MAEYKLNYTAEEINEKLGKIDSLETADAETLAMAKAYTDSQRLAHAEVAITELVPETTVQFKTDNDETGLDYTTINPVALTPGTVYEVMFDGAVYNCTLRDVGSRSILGNSKLLDQNDTGEPFIMNASVPNKLYAYTTNKATHTFRITVTEETIHPIDPKYLPDTVATKADIFGAMEASY